MRPARDVASALLTITTSSALSVFMPENEGPSFSGHDELALNRLPAAPVVPLDGYRHGDATILGRGIEAITGKSRGPEHAHRFTNRPPVLHVTVTTDEPVAVALVLHGGQRSSYAPTKDHQLAVARARPFVQAIHHREPSFAVARLRYRLRGWNEPHAHPMQDVAFALDHLTEAYPDRPVVLVGHSLGGRAAIRAAGHPSVVGAVALAPWLAGQEPVGQLEGRSLVIIHGLRDKLTDPRASLAYATHARDHATEVACVQLVRTEHTMMRRARLWHRLAADYVSVLARRGDLESVVPAATLTVARI